MRKKQSLHISIPKPCHEDWDKMTVSEKGRHCASCNKTVIDFSLYSDRELVNFFKNVQDNVCGHMPVYNLNRPILVTETPNRSLFHKLFMGTALAGWLGLSVKADAQNATPHPVTMQNNLNHTKNKVAREMPDTSNNYIQFTFIDSVSRKAVPYIDITISGENFSRYYSSDKNIFKAYIPGEQVGKALRISFSNYEYAAKEIEITAQKLPLRKKILLVFTGPKVMVNGGLGIRYEKDK